MKAVLKTSVITSIVLLLFFGLLFAFPESPVAQGLGELAERLSTLRNRVSDEFSYWTVKNGDDSDREKVVNQLTDQDVLLRVAQAAETDRGFRAAINRITNQDYLFGLAMTVRPDSIKKDVVERITNQAYLSEIAGAEAAMPFSARMAAAQRVSDQNFLFEVARSATDLSVLGEVVGRITNEEFLLHIARSSGSYSIRQDAVRRLGDLDSLIEIAQKDVVFSDVAERLRTKPYPYSVQLEAANRAQCLLGRQHADIECIEDCSEEPCSVLALMVLDPLIVERHGLVIVEIETSERSFRYTGSNLVIIEDYAVTITDSKGDVVLDRTFASDSPADVEIFRRRQGRGVEKKRRSRIDYNGIHEQLRSQ